jgi:hypothetical protein
MNEQICWDESGELVEKRPAFTEECGRVSMAVARSYQLSAKATLSDLVDSR